MWLVTLFHRRDDRDDRRDDRDDRRDDRDDRDDKRCGTLFGNSLCRLDSDS